MGFYIPEVVVGDARRHNVQVLPADVGKSAWACSIEREDGKNERSEIEGEAPQAMPVEGATRAPLIARSEIEGEAPQAMPVEGACDPRGIVGSRQQSAGRGHPAKTGGGSLEVPSIAVRLGLRY